MSKKIAKWDHTALCHFMGEYAKKKMNAGLVFVEHKTMMTHQIPDVLIYRQTCTIELEIKVNRADFLADQKKPHRMDPSKGVGDYRFYVAPKGMIKVEELPEHWGLLEVSGKRVYKTHVPPSFQCLYGNREYLMSAIKQQWKEFYKPERYPGYRKHIQRSIRRDVADVSFIFPEKDISAETSFLYAAHRQEIIASQKGLIKPAKDIVWVRPFNGDMMDEGRLLR
ncbi:hypothetical protein [Vibrio phage BX-1]|nr:hypothetical protein [Vibrio phage BX-1]